MNANWNSADLQTMIFTESQVMLRDMVQRYVTDNSATLSTPGPEQCRLTWTDFAQSLGILGLALDEDHGGLACGAIETMLVVEELGAGLAAEPFISTAITAAALLNAAQSARALTLSAHIAAGSGIVATAIGKDCAVSALNEGERWRLNGRTGITVSGGVADTLLVPVRNETGRDIVLMAVPTGSAGLERRDLELLDNNPAAEFIFENVAVESTALVCEAAQAAIAVALDVAAAAHCAELVGIMQRMLNDTIAYTSQRTQFGQPLARFQVLQHRMAAMYVEIELARSMALMAALAIDGPPADRACAVHAALARNLKAARLVAHGAVQLHGGIGTTNELALGRYFKRVRTLASLLGTVDSHITGFATSAAED